MNIFERKLENPRARYQVTKQKNLQIWKNKMGREGNRHLNQIKKSIAPISYNIEFKSTKIKYNDFVETIQSYLKEHPLPTIVPVHHQTIPTNNATHHDIVFGKIFIYTRH